MFLKRGMVASTDFELDWSGHYKGQGVPLLQARRWFRAHGESMTKDDSPVLVYTTFARLDDAKRVGDALVAAKLAACVNIFPGMISIYEWKGAREVASEVAMIVKTRRALADAVLAETKRLHPYEL